MKHAKRLLALGIAALMLCGCVENKPQAEYVPTGDALLMEGQDPEELEEEEAPQELTLAYYPDRSMNPLIGNNITNRSLFSLIYQGLFATDSNYNTYPILCSHYQVSSDNKTWTIYIEPSATFSDGTQLTAQDVLATYEAAKESNYYGGRFTHILAMSLSGSDSITFQLETPYENLALLLDIPILKASEVKADFPLGTGPYAFVQGATAASLSKVANWWCGSAKVPARALTIHLIEGASQSQIRDEFEFGDLTLAVANPMTDSYAEYRCDYELWNTETGVFTYLACNVLYSPFFKDDDTLRKALTYAIDREYINDTFYNGLAQPSTLPSSPSSPYYNKSLADKYAYDDMKFVDAISGLDLPEDKNRQPKKMLILVNCDDSARLRTARYLAQHLTSLGVPTGTLEYGGSTSVTYEEVLRAGNFDLYLGQTKLPPTMELTAFFRGWGNLGFGGITDGTLYNMTKEALANSGNYYNLNQMVADDAKVIPVLFGANCVYSDRGQLLDLSPFRDNVFFYTLDKTMESAKVTSSATGEG